MEHDKITGDLASFAATFPAAGPPPAAAHAVTRSVLDALGCALAALPAAPCTAARSVAATAEVPNGSSVIGSPLRTTPEYAAFANSVMVRHLDLNDTYHSAGGGHPSDMLPAFVALGEPLHASGADIVRAMHVAYEVFATMADAVPLRHHGWDPGAFIGLGTAAGAAHLLGLDTQRAASALSATLTANMPMGVTRTGELSNWKGCATPYACSAAVFVTRLAQQGITGPPQPFAGAAGFFELVGCGPVEPAAVGAPKDGRSAAERCALKLFPSQFDTQIPATAFIGLHHDGVRPDDVDAIDVRTYHIAWFMSGGGNDDHADKWDPSSPETADHSIPYVIAAALTDGTLDAGSFTLERVLDPALRPLMRKITVTSDEGITATWQSAPAQDITVRMYDGTRRHLRAERPHGHPADPLTDDEVTDKFVANASRATGPARARELADLVWTLPEIDDIGRLTAALRRISP